jgi:hypothetical protein
MDKYIAIILLLTPFWGVAQSADTRQENLLGKGKLHIGVGLSQEIGGSFGINRGFTPRLQYFVSNGWSLALEGTLEKNYATQNTMNGVGLNTRYYFMRAQRLALFGEVGATIGRSKINYPDTNGTGFLRLETSTVFRTHAGLGAHYRLGERWSMEAGLARMLSNSQNATNLPGYAPWRAKVSVNFRIR